MALRLLEIVLPTSVEKWVEELIKDHQMDVLPTIPLASNMMIVRFLLEAEEAEGVIEKFHDAFSTLEGFRITLIPLEATVPEHKSWKEVEKERKKEELEAAKMAEAAKEAATETLPAEPPLVGGSATSPTPATPEMPSEDSESKTAKPTPAKKRRLRISRDELYSDLSDAVKFNAVYLVLVMLSVIVAAVGLVQNNSAVIIGAMVIAPLLAPNVALSLATTLANRKLAGKALLALSLGLLLALGLSFLLGLFLEVDPTVSEIALRTNVEFTDMIIGLAAGAAAALFFSLGMGTSLVGVTVAAALLPPLVVTGLLVGAGRVDLAWQSLLIVISNLIGINLAGTVVFILQGVWPISWWEEGKAKRTAMTAVTLWVLLFLVLVFIILVVEDIVPFQWTWPFIG